MQGLNHPTVVGRKVSDGQNKGTGHGISGELLSKAFNLICIISKLFRKQD